MKEQIYYVREWAKGQVKPVASLDILSINFNLCFKTMKEAREAKATLKRKGASSDIVIFDRYFGVEL